MNSICDILTSYLSASHLCLLDKENYNIIKRLISIGFKHINNSKSIEEKENNKKDMKDLITLRSFLLDELKRRNIISSSISPFAKSNNYSIYVIYII